MTRNSATGAVNKRESGSGTWRPLLASGKALPGGSFSCRLKTPAAEEDDDGAAPARGTHLQMKAK
uniref:Uncharacterized protein n=1 Tax=Oryza glumipatula TaxID=40148 RepID=A0A0D9YX15_9ORYZ